MRMRPLFCTLHTFSSGIPSEVPNMTTTLKCVSESVCIDSEDNDMVTARKNDCTCSVIQGCRQQGGGVEMLQHLNILAITTIINSLQCVLSKNVHSTYYTE